VRHNREAERQLAEAFKRGRVGRFQFEANILSAYGGSRTGWAVIAASSLFRTVKQ